MTCERCGSRCHGRYCTDCSRMIARDDVHQDTAPEPDDPLRYRCTSCGAEYETVGDDPCPSCGARRRRYLPPESPHTSYGVPPSAIDVLDEDLWRDPTPARRAVVIQDLRGNFPPEWAIAPSVEQPFKPASDCSRAVDDLHLITDGGTEYFGGPESKSARQLRVAIGAAYGRDLRERVDSIGNSPAAVAFRRPLLEEIAADVLDDVAVDEVGVQELRTMVARALDREPPAGHFTWLHLRDIYETVVDPEPVADPEQLDIEQEESPARTERTIAGPSDDGCHDINWGREQ